MAVPAIKDPLRAGDEALARGAWAEARDHFEAALSEGESAAAWEGLGWTGWWLADEELTFRARERAYRAYRSEGDALGAGRVAAWLASDFREFRGEVAVGLGWMRRAHRLLEPLPTAAEHGWLALIDVDFVLNVDADADRALPLSRRATEIGRELEVPDIEAVGLAQQGIALVGKGEVDEGMRLLDEASGIAASEDLHLPVSLGWALCCMISACDGVGDFDRAAQWFDSMREFTERWGGRQILGVCRSSYGRVLATRGDWPAAEVELTAAVEDLELARPALVTGGLVRLGELRLRQGRSDDARELFERAGAPGLIGLGELALATGDAVTAVDAAERFLRRLPASALLDRLPGLELLARARAASGELAAAGEAIDDLEVVADRLGTPYVRGRIARAVAEVALAGGDHDSARRSFEDSIDCFAEASAPYDTAIARFGLARALAELGRGEHAERELMSARETFVALGARRDAELAEAPLPRPGATGDIGLDQLTRREVEVLRLVATGMGDAAIAEQLVVSPHTVHRHVANIRTKLGLTSRAAAVAYATREGLL